MRSTLQIIEGKNIMKKVRKKSVLTNLVCARADMNMNTNIRMSK